MGVKVVQLTSKSHHESILASLHQLRLQGQLSDVTVQVDYEGDVQEFHAHQVMLAASSAYFKNALLSQDAARDKFQLSNMRSNDFSKFLEFVYTGKVEVAREKIVDVHAAAEFLGCEALLEVCGQAMSAGVLQERTKKKSKSDVVDEDGAPAAKRARRKKGKKLPKNVCLKRLMSPQSSDKEGVLKRFKAKTADEKRQGTRLKLKLAGHKVLQRHLNVKRGASNKVYKVTSEVTVETEDGDEAEAQTDKQTKNTDESSSPAADEEDFQVDEDGQSNGPEEPLCLSMEGEEVGEEEEDEEEEEDGQEEDTLKRTSKAQFQCNKCQRTFHYERSYLKHIR